MICVKVSVRRQEKFQRCRMLMVQDDQQAAPVVEGYCPNLWSRVGWSARDMKWQAMLSINPGVNAGFEHGRWTRSTGASTRMISRASTPPSRSTTASQDRKCASEYARVGSS